MIHNFTMNGILWRVEIVDPDSPMLVDRTRTHTVATTDPSNHTVYLSSELQGPFFIKVLLHELGHCVMVSYGLIEKIRASVYPEQWIEAEEWICNFIADYGFKIFSAAYKIVGEDAWRFLPQELEKFVA